MRIRIAPYKAGSVSAKELSRALNVKRIFTDNRSKFRSRYSDVIINWGMSSLPTNCLNARVIVNHAAGVSLSSNKISTLQTLKNNNIACPEFTTSLDTAYEWLEGGATVFARKLLSAHSGRGIEVLTFNEYLDDDIPEKEDIPYAPLYTKYIKKKYEYRAHAFSNGKVYITQKRRSNSVPDDQVNWLIRNHGNGFIYAQEVAYMPDDIEELALNALDALGLDFAAFDVVYNSHENKSYIIEANTAPGLTGTTIQVYADNIRKIINDRSQSNSR